MTNDKDNSKGNSEVKKEWPVQQEYASLRTEIFYWQNFRFVLLAASIALMSGIIGFLNKNSDLWMKSSCLLLVFLTAAVVLSWYAGRGNAKIGAYLTVFHEEPLKKDSQQYKGWEDRQGRFIKQMKQMKLPQRVFDWLKLSHCLGAIYILLGILSVVLPWSAGGQNWPLTKDHWIWIGTPAALFLGAMILLIFLSSPRDPYKACWLEVQKNEEQQSKVISENVRAIASQLVNSELRALISRVDKLEERMQKQG